MEDSTVQASPVTETSTEGATPDPKDTPAVFGSPDTQDQGTAADASSKADPTPVDDNPRLARGFAALSRKEKALRLREAELESKSTAITKAQALRDSARTNPLAILEEYGLTYEQLTDAILGTEKAPPTHDEKLAALEARFEAEAKAKEEARASEGKAAVERSIATFKEHILKPGLRAEADKFELINARGDDGAELVFEVIESYHETHGTILPWAKAAESVEAHLETEARKLLGLKKFAAKAAVSEGTNEGVSTATLTRSTGGDIPVISDGDDLPMDSMERNKALMAKYRLWG